MGSKGGNVTSRWGESEKDTCLLSEAAHQPLSSLVLGWCLHCIFRSVSLAPCLAEIRGLMTVYWKKWLLTEVHLRFLEPRVHISGDEVEFQSLKPTPGQQPELMSADVLCCFDFVPFDPWLSTTEGILFLILKQKSTPKAMTPASNFSSPPSPICDFCLWNWISSGLVCSVEKLWITLKFSN